MVLTYADDIFQTGRELVDAVRGRSTGKPKRFRIGIADVMAKMVAFELLLPALDEGADTVLECHEDEPNRLFADLAVSKLDLVLSDIPLAPGIDVRAYNHVMGESSTTLFAAPVLHARLGADFPRSLNDAPFLMPSQAAAIRRSLELWLGQEGVRPKTVAEFEDGALMKVFGEAGRGVFPGPTIVRDHICKNYNVRVVGELKTVRERFYAISPERKIRHPGVARIVESAKSGIFGGVTE